MESIDIIWQYWAIIALFCIVIEVFTTGFAFLSFAFGTIVAAIFSAFEASFGIQLLAFSLATTLSFIFVRPLALKLTRGEIEKVETNGHALIGRIGIVEEDFTKLGGRVVIDGDNWKAVAENGELFTKGTSVKVIEINSIIITVKKV